MDTHLKGGQGRTEKHRLVEFISNHGHQAWVMTGEIHVIEQWIDADGRHGSTVITLPASIRAVKDWLGY